MLKLALQQRISPACLPSAYELAGRHVHLGKLKAVQTCCGGKLGAQNGS